MTKLDMLAQVSAEMGWPEERRTAPAAYNCPTHTVPLTHQQASTFDGWFQVTTCPSFDGTCAYDPDATPTRITAPEDVEPSTTA